MLLGYGSASKFSSLPVAIIRCFTNSPGELALVNKLKSSRRAIHNLHLVSQTYDRSDVLEQAYETLALAHECLAGKKLKGHVHASLEAGVRGLEAELIIENDTLESSFAQFEISIQNGSVSTTLPRLRTLLVACVKTMRRDLVDRMVLLIRANEGGLQIDLETLNAFITGFGQMNDADGARDLFSSFQKDVKVNSSTFVSLLKAFARSGHVANAVWAYNESLRIFHRDQPATFTYSERLLSKDEDISQVEWLQKSQCFASISETAPLSREPPAVVRAAFIDACIQGGEPERALEYVKEKDCLGNSVLSNAFLSVLSRVGDYERASQFLRKLEAKGTIRIKHSTLIPLVKASIRARELGDGRIYVSTSDLVERISMFCDPLTDNWTVKLLLKHAKMEGDINWVNYLETVLAELQTEVVASFNYNNKKMSFTNEYDSKVSALADLFTRRGLFRASLRSDAFLKTRTGRSQSLKYHLDQHAEKRALLCLLDLVSEEEVLHIEVSGLPMCPDCRDFFSVCANFYGKLITTQDGNGSQSFVPSNTCSIR